jgi:hypothetical protein
VIVPWARANAEHAERLLAMLATSPLSTRDCGAGSSTTSRPTAPPASTWSTVTLWGESMRYPSTWWGQISTPIHTATVTFDEFRAVKLINEAVDKVRRSEQGVSRDC